MTKNNQTHQHTTNLEYVNSLQIDPLPEQFIDTMANCIGKRNTFGADSEYYPYKFLDVRLVMQHGGMLRNLDSFLDRQRRMMRFRSFLSIYSVRQYDIVDNSLGHDKDDKYKAVASPMAADAKLEEHGELSRNII